MYVRGVEEGEVPIPATIIKPPALHVVDQRAVVGAEEDGAAQGRVLVEELGGGLQVLLEGGEPGRSVWSLDNE